MEMGVEFKDEELIVEGDNEEGWVATHSIEPSGTSSPSWFVQGENYLMHWCLKFPWTRGR